MLSGGGPVTQARFSGLACALLAACSTSVAPENPYDPNAPPGTQAKATLRGALSSPGNYGIGGVVLTLASDGQAVKQTTTAADGSFVVDQIEPGSYVLEGSPPGFEALSLPVMLGVGATLDLGQIPIHDITPPSGGSLTIDGGAAVTNDPTAHLALSATGATQMRVSIDGVAQGAGWVPIAASPNYPMSGDGTHRFAVQFRSVGLVEGADVSASIVLDTHAPGGGGIIELVGSLGNGTTLSSLATAPAPARSNSAAVIGHLTAPTADTAFAALAQVIGGGSCSTAFGTIDWQPFATDISVVLAGGDGLYTVCAIFMDQVGNYLTSGQLTPISAQILLDTQPPTNPVIVSPASGTTNATSATVTIAPAVDTRTDGAGHQLPSTVFYECSGGQFSGWTACTPSGSNQLAFTLPLNAATNLEVRAHDDVYNYTAASIIDMVQRTRPPASPAVQSVQATSNSITLSWSPTAAAVSYLVNYTELPGNPGTGAAQGNSPVGAGTATTFGLTGLKPSTLYFVSVTAVDAAGNQSDPSGVRLVETQNVNPRVLSTYAATAGSVGSLGPRVYIASRQSVARIDMTNDTSAVVTGRASLPLLAPANPSNLPVVGCTYLGVSGDCVFVAASTFEGTDSVLTVVFFDTTPGVKAVGVPVAQMTVPAQELTLGGTRLYVAGSNKTTGLSSLTVYDVSDPTQPVRLAQAPIPTGPLPSYTNDSSGAYIFGAGLASNRYYVITLGAVVVGLSGYPVGNLYLNGFDIGSTPAIAAAIGNGTLAADTSLPVVGSNGAALPNVNSFQLGLPQTMAVVVSGPNAGVYFSYLGPGGYQVSNYGSPKGLSGTASPVSTLVFNPNASLTYPYAGRGMAADQNKLYLLLEDFNGAQFGSHPGPSLGGQVVLGSTMTLGETIPSSFSTVRPAIGTFNGKTYLLGASSTAATLTSAFAVGPNGTSLLAWRDDASTSMTYLTPYVEIAAYAVAAAQGFLFQAYGLASSVWPAAYGSDLQTVDISNPLIPTPVSDIHLAPSSGVAYEDLLARGHHLFAVNSPSVDYYRIEASGSLTLLQTITAASNSNPAIRTAVSGRYLYIARTFSPSGIEVWDLLPGGTEVTQTNPAVRVAQTVTTGTGIPKMKSIEVHGSAIYTTDGTGLYLWTVSGANVTQVGTTTCTTTCTGGQVCGTGGYCVPPVSGGGDYLLARGDLIAVGSGANTGTGVGTSRVLGSGQFSSDPVIYPFLGNTLLQGGYVVGLPATVGDGLTFSIYGSGAVDGVLPLLQCASYKNDLTHTTNSTQLAYADGVYLTPCSFGVAFGGPYQDGTVLSSVASRSGGKLFSVSGGAGAASDGSFSYFAGSEFEYEDEKFLASGSTSPAQLDRATSKAPVDLIESEGKIFTVEVGTSSSAYVYDAAAPTAPWPLLGSTSVTGSGGGPSADDGQLFYFSLNNSINVLDLRPLPPSFTTPAAMQGFQPWQLFAHRQRLYAPQGNNKGAQGYPIKVWDITNPASPLALSDIDVGAPVNETPSSYLLAVTVAGQYLIYVNQYFATQTSAAVSYSLGAVTLGPNLDGAGASAAPSYFYTTSQPLSSLTQVGELLYVVQNNGLATFDLAPLFAGSGPPRFLGVEGTGDTALPGNSGKLLVRGPWAFGVDSHIFDLR